MSAISKAVTNTSVHKLPFDAAVDVVSPDAKYDVFTTVPQFEFPGSMDTGYKNLKIPVAGNATISIQDSKDSSRDLDYLIGKPVIVSVSVLITTSTQLDKAQGKLSIDLGKLLTGVIGYMVTPRISSSAYTRRLVAVAFGFLAQSVQGRWAFNFDWSVRHGVSVDDQYDSFTVIADCTIMGSHSDRHVVSTS